MFDALHNHAGSPPRSHATLRLTLLSALALPLFFVGCKSSTPAPATQTTAIPAKVESFPPRPTVPSPPFKVFDHRAGSFTLTTKENATDEEIEALVWALRDATRSRTLDKLKISQKTFDADGSNIWFHIYRGTKCAAEKYVHGNPPCGGSYHAAGDYTYSNFNNHPWDSGTLLHDESHEVRLWNPDAPYTAATTTK